MLTPVPAAPDRDLLTKALAVLTREVRPDGAVLQADLDQARGLVTGRVRGSGGRVHQCIIRLGAGDHGGVQVSGQCSCRVGSNCGHVAAVLLKLADAGQAPASTGLPLAVGNWLHQVEETARHGATDPHCIVYVLRLGLRASLRCLELRALKARQLASGGYGKAERFAILGESGGRFVTADDRRIATLSRAAHAGGEGDGLRLEGALAADILAVIARTGRGHWQELEGPVLRLAGPLPGRLDWRLGSDAQLHITLEAERPGLVLLPVTPPWYLDPSSGECGPLQTGLHDEEAGLLARAPAIAPGAAAALRESIQARAGGLDLPLPSPPRRRRAEKVRPMPALRLYSEDLARAVERRSWTPVPPPDWRHGALLTFDYGGAVVDPRTPAQTFETVDGGVLIEGERDLLWEQAAIRVLHELGLTRSADLGDRPGLHLERAAGDDTGWLLFIQHGVPRLRQLGWRIDLDPSFRFQISEVGDWHADIAEHGGGRWLDLALGIDVDGERVDLLPLLLKLLRELGDELSPRRLAELEEGSTLMLRLDDARLIALPVERLRPILTTLVELYDGERPLSQDDRLRLPRLQAAALAELEEADPELDWHGGAESRALGRRLRDFTGIEPVAPPPSLAAELRPYQRKGLDWLQFLRSYGLGGVLADDMGLGKTVQALAHLLVEHGSDRADRPSLVVAPTSLMFNWRREAARFAPSLKVLLLHGPDRRRRFGDIAAHDLVLTTYPLLPRDLDTLSAQPWHLLILDEAQAIKNPRSKAAAAVRALDARHRLCLTGTPLENHLGELWALLDVLMPDALGDERRFKRLFRTPIERDGDTMRQEQLRRRVAPFLLRRTKDAVAAELPPKTEILREAPLASDQRDLYEALRLSLHEKVQAEVARQGLAQSGIIILDALLKLRQVCCDPRLVALDSARKVKGSAKLEMLMALVPELLEEGRRVLLFSQFTSMLALIEEALAETGRRADRDFVKLTGRTRDRQTPVDRFQSGQVPLFLISLKAGGSGLNLTAADTVIHYDPWWNPAVERQATDRAHRIGQNKPVFVYKLLTEGTVEQRVAELQARKQALADAMLAGGGAAARSLSADDLELLFAPLDD